MATEKEKPLRSRNWLALASCLALATGLAACGSSSTSTKSSSSSSGGGAPTAPAGTVNGAGSTFAAPIYQQWGSALKGQGITVNYQAVGSGAGITQWAAGTADFGASDPPLKPKSAVPAAHCVIPAPDPTAW